MTESYPRISVITPSFNQSEFLERTIQSVLSQNYPNLEYIIIDGGSTDASLDVIARYSSQLAYWESAPDRGQSHAINKGIELATGDWVCWQNSDDIFYPITFLEIAKTITAHPGLDFIVGDINLINSQDAVIRPMCYVKPTYKSLLAEGMVLTNQAAFWRRSIHNKIGFLDETLHYGFDFEWFLRLLKHTSKSYHIPKFLGALRYHPDTKTSLNQPKFKIEYASILQGRELSSVQKNCYVMRRLLLTLANGKFAYVFNGLIQRLTKQLSKNPIDCL